MKTYQGSSLVAARQRVPAKALRAMRSRGLRAASAGAVLACTLLGLPACGQKGPLTLPPPHAAASAASSPAR